MNTKTKLLGLTYAGAGGVDYTQLDPAKVLGQEGTKHTTEIFCII